MKGFSLLELLIVLAIISILATIAFPHYSTHLYKSRRLEGQLALLSLANTMERYYLTHHTYQGATLKNLAFKEFSEEGHYQLSLTTPTPQSFSLTATPRKAQTDDPCGKLTLNQQNEKGADAPNCW